MKLYILKTILKEKELLIMGVRENCTLLNNKIRYIVKFL